MNVRYNRSQNAIIFVLGGNVVGGDATRLRQGFERLIERRGRDLPVVVDCADTQTMDSSALGALVWAHSQIVKRGSGRLGLTNVSASFERLLTRADLLRLFEVYPDEDSALRGIHP